MASHRKVRALGRRAAPLGDQVCCSCWPANLSDALVGLRSWLASRESLRMVFRACGSARPSSRANPCISSGSLMDLCFPPLLTTSRNGNPHR
ncbi:hypothetical protein FKM82_029644 [Ascaphus truei]